LCRRGLGDSSMNHLVSPVIVGRVHAELPFSDKWRLYNHLTRMVLAQADSEAEVREAFNRAFNRHELVIVVPVVVVDSSPGHQPDPLAWTLYTPAFEYNIMSSFDGLSKRMLYEYARTRVDMPGQSGVVLVRPAASAPQDPNRRRRMDTDTPWPQFRPPPPLPMLELLGAGCDSNPFSSPCLDLMQALTCEDAALVIAESALNENARREMQIASRFLAAVAASPHVESVLELWIMLLAKGIDLLRCPSVARALPPAALGLASYDRIVSKIKVELRISSVCPPCAQQPPLGAATSRNAGHEEAGHRPDPFEEPWEANPSGVSRTEYDPETPLRISMYDSPEQVRQLYPEANDRVRNALGFCDFGQEVSREQFGLVSPSLVQLEQCVQAVQDLTCDDVESVLAAMGPEELDMMRDGVQELVEMLAVWEDQVVRVVRVAAHGRALLDCDSLVALFPGAREAAKIVPRIGKLLQRHLKLGPQGCPRCGASAAKVPTAAATASPTAAATAGPTAATTTGTTTGTPKATTKVTTTAATRTKTKATAAARSTPAKTKTSATSVAPKSAPGTPAGAPATPEATTKAGKVASKKKKERSHLLMLFVLLFVLMIFIGVLVGDKHSTASMVAISVI